MELSPSADLIESLGHVHELHLLHVCARTNSRLDLCHLVPVSAPPPAPATPSSSTETPSHTLSETELFGYSAMQEDQVSGKIARHNMVLNMPAIFSAQQAQDVQ